MDPQLVAEAAVKLETIFSPLSSPQFEAVIIRLATEDSRLRVVDFNLDFVDISSLDPQIVVGALIKLERILFAPCPRLAPVQVISLFSRIRDSPNQRLSQLRLWSYDDGMDYTVVPTEVLVGAIRKLEVVDFGGGEMTEEQLTAILLMAKERKLGRIKRFQIRNVIGMSSVSPSLLQAAQLNDALEWK